MRMQSISVFDKFLYLFPINFCIVCMRKINPRQANAVLPAELKGMLLLVFACVSSVTSLAWLNLISLIYCLNQMNL